MSSTRVGMFVNCVAFECLILLLLGHRGTIEWILGEVTFIYWVDVVGKTAFLNLRINHVGFVNIEI